MHPNPMLLVLSEPCDFAPPIRKARRFVSLQGCPNLGEHSSRHCLLRLRSARTCGLFRTRCQKPHTARVLLDRSSRQSASFSNPRIDSKRTRHERSWTPFRLAVNISTVSGVFGGTSRIARPVNKSITIDTSHREFLPVDFLSCPALLFPDGKVVLEDRESTCD